MLSNLVDQVLRIYAKILVNHTTNKSRCALGFYAFVEGKHACYPKLALQKQLFSAWSERASVGATQVFH